MLEIMCQLHLTVYNFCWAPKAPLARPPHIIGSAMAVATPLFQLPSIGAPYPVNPPQTSSSPILTLSSIYLHLSLDQSGVPINFHSLPLPCCEVAPASRSKVQPSEGGFRLSPENVWKWQVAIGEF